MFLDSILFFFVSRFSLRLPLIVAAVLAAPLLLMDGALCSASIVKWLIAGPYNLSYPSRTFSEQGASTKLGPVPGNSWVAFIPLLVALFIFASSACAAQQKPRVCFALMCTQ